MNPRTLFLLIVGYTAILYSGVLNCDFVNFDDHLYVTSSDLTKAGLTLQSVTSAFSSFHVVNWHPLTMLSYMLDFEIYGLNPSGYHLTNLLLHSITAGLVFLFLFRSTGFMYRSAAVALLFAIHPLRVESVAWISERKDVLCVFFAIASLLFYERYARTFTRKFYYLTLLTFALALLSKSMVVTLPFVFLLLDFWPYNRIKMGPKLHFDQKENTNIHPSKDNRGRSLWNCILEKAPFFVLTIGFSIITYASQETAMGPDSFGDRLEPVTRMLYGYFNYFSKTLLPVNLVAFYPVPMSGYPVYFLVLTGITIIGASVAVFLRKSPPYLLVGWFWFMGTMFPVSGVIQIGTQAFADRYTYFPHIGLILLVVWSMADYLKEFKYQKWIVSGILGSLVLIYSGLTIRQIQTWKNSFTLWNHILTTPEVSPNALINLAEWYSVRREFEKSLPLLQTAKKMSEMPSHRNLFNLGSNLVQLGRSAEAIETLKQANAMNSFDSKYAGTLAFAYEFTGDLPSALKYWRISHQIEPKNLYFSASVLCLEKKMSPITDNNSDPIGIPFDERWIKSTISTIWIMATDPLFEPRNPLEAVFNGERLRCLSPKNPEVLTALAAAYADAGNFDNATRLVIEAIDIAKDSNYPESHLADLQNYLASFQAKNPLSISTKNSKQ